jgi:RNA polymerase sigma-70 factor (ECF subfamily)
MDERQAIARLKAGDIAALDTLVELFYVRAVRAAFLVTRDRPLAEDVVQTAFLRAYERIAQFDSARPFAPWFLRVVVNDAVKAVTRRPTLALDAIEVAESTLLDPGPDPLRRLEQAETEAAVQAALDALPPEQRAAIVLRYYLGLTEPQIAAAQAVPPGTVKWRLHAARRRLRGLLAPLRPTSPPDPLSARGEGE